jgi:hypothetical protein
VFDVNYFFALTTTISLDRADVLIVAEHPGRCTSVRWWAAISMRVPIKGTGWFALKMWTRRAVPRGVRQTFFGHLRYLALNGTA